MALECAPLSRSEKIARQKLTGIFFSCHRVSLPLAASFVGFHTALQLHEEGDTVLGLDNFNHYYDVRLKRTRASLLRRAGMTTLFEGDVCDGETQYFFFRIRRDE